MTKKRVKDHKPKENAGKETQWGVTRKGILGETLVRQASKWGDEGNSNRAEYCVQGTTHRGKSKGNDKDEHTTAKLDEKKGMRD